MTEKQRYIDECKRYREELYKKPRLRFLFFELTDCCNLSCRHCGSRCSPQNATYLDKKPIFKVLEEVKAAYGTDEIMVCLTGGEPLLHPDFFGIIESIDRYGFRWGMTTNATLINSSAAERIIRAHMTSVSYSIDGTPDSHNFLRRNTSAFERCVAGIENLKKYKDSFVSMVTTVVHKQNIDSLDEIYGVVRSLGVDSWRITNVDPIGNAEDSDLLLEYADYTRLFEYVKRLRADPDCKTEITYGCAHYLGDGYEGELRDGCFFCGAGTQVGSVCANGDIYACLDIERLPELVQGNVKRDSFVHAWENKFGFFRQNRALLNETCAECDDRELCAGDSAHTWNYRTDQPKFCIKKGEKR